MSLTRNVRAGYIGQAWTAFMGLTFVPVYIRYMGMEAWGLVGFMSMMQAWLTLLDMGLAPTLSREMARFSAGGLSAQSIRNLLRSLEVLYVGVALLVVLIVTFAAPWLVGRWLRVEQLPQQTVVQAISLMGLVLAARMTEQVYRGAIQGMQQLVWLNTAQSLLATLRWAGAVGILAWVSPTVEAFFVWQGAVSVVTVVVFAAQTYRWLPSAAHRGRFDVAELRLVSRFAGGMAATALLAVLLTQADKLILSSMLTLDQFGLYALAGVVSGSLYFLVGPLASAVSPRLTELVARSDQTLVAATYHRASQWAAVFLLAPALILAGFSERVLWAWTGDAQIAERAGPVLTVLALGTMLNGCMQIPYLLQIANGWTGLAVRMNLVGVLIIVPGMLWAVPRWGSVGAACAWLTLNAAYVLLGVYVMHHRLLPAEKWRWYREALLVPLATGGLVSAALLRYWPVTNSRMLEALLLVLATALTAMAVCVVTPEPRKAIWTRMMRGRGHRGAD